jgi:hypothetical protein
MGNDDTYDFVSARNGYSYIWETENQSLIFRENIGAISCIPADLDYDGLTDVICTYPTGTKVYSADYTNLNAYIYSVSFSPSAVIEVNSTLTATVTAIDPEDDSIYYSIRCNNTGSYSTETDNPIQTCYYNTLGNYQVTIRVRDEFHGTYDTLTQDIEVALTSYTQAEGGVAIPTKLVDVDDTEQGLLPSIYYGTLGFFSNILSPLFIIVVLFLSMAIIITIIGIAVKLIHKASSIG